MIPAVASPRATIVQTPRRGVSWGHDCATISLHGYRTGVPGMSQNTAEVVIIGAGIVGASIAYHLAVRGCTNVVLLEQAETEVSGSSARSAAGVRHQFSSEVNVLLSLYRDRKTSCRERS